MKARLLRDMRTKRCPRWPDGIQPKGEILDNPMTFRLVQMGVAEPVDEECAKRAGRTPEQIKAASAAYEKADRGITQKDSAAYDRGELTGYNPDGTRIRGPNYQDEDSDLDELDEDEEESDFGDEDESDS